MLTNCIENLLCGVIPEEPFVLQLVDYWRVMNPTNGIFKSYNSVEFLGGGGW